MNRELPFVFFVCCAAQGPTVESLAQEERDARAPGSGRASGSGTEEHPERRSKPEKPARAERSQPALNTFKSTEEIDNMAALLAGKSLDKDVCSPMCRFRFFVSCDSSVRNSDLSAPV